MVKERILTDHQKAFLTTLLGEARGNFQLAKRLAGYADSVSVAEIVRSLRDELREAALEALTMSSITAAFKVDDIMNKGDIAGASNVLKAATLVLDRVGVRPPDEVSFKVPTGGLFIMPAKRGTNVPEVTEPEE